MVRRPKSIATVVVVLSMPGSRWSTDSLAAVIQASVFTGGISEMAATQVVLPTPKPPAITILAEVSPGRDGAGWTGSGKLPETITDPFQQAEIAAGVLGVDEQPVAGGEVVEHHPGHPQRHAGVRGEFGDRLGTPGRLV